MKAYDRLNWSVGIAIFILLAIAAMNVRAALPEGVAPGPYHAWFEAQRTPDDSDRSCCVEADGHILDEDQLRIVDGEYEVLTTSGEWLRFPNKGQGHHGNTVLGFTGNPTGSPVAWYIGGVALCLAEGTTT